MTRINIVDPKHLTDKHLLAEYKEITRPFNKVIKRIEKYGVDNALNDVDIPAYYVLGVGHESFFFNKLGWLNDRYGLIMAELLKRKVNIDMAKFNGIRDDFICALFKTKYWNDYKPTPEEIYLNMSRLCKRSNIESVLVELKSDN